MLQLGAGLRETHRVIDRTCVSFARLPDPRAMKQPSEANSNPLGLPPWPEVEARSDSVEISAKVWDPRCAKSLAALVWLISVATMFSLREQLASVPPFAAFLDGSIGYDMPVLDLVFLGAVALAPAFLIFSFSEELGMARAEARLVFSQESIAIAAPKIHRTLQFNPAIKTVEFFAKPSEVGTGTSVHLIFGYEEIELFSIDSKTAPKDARNFVSCCEWALENQRSFD